MGLGSDEWWSWCLDEAVYAWGTYVEDEMAGAANTRKKESEKHAARHQCLQRLLSATTKVPGTDVEPPPNKGAFRDPANMMKAKQKGT